MTMTTTTTALVIGSGPSALAEERGRSQGPRGQRAQLALRATLLAASVAVVARS